MAEIGKLLCSVRSKTKTYSFLVQVHRAERADEQVIEAEFYQQTIEQIHEGVHHELQLLASPVWGSAQPDSPVHVHKNPQTGKSFVCYTHNIPTIEAAEKILKFWCVGTVYSIENDRDFSPVAGQHPDDFFQFMSSEFGIELEA